MLSPLKDLCKITEVHHLTQESNVPSTQESWRAQEGDLLGHVIVFSMHQSHVQPSTDKTTIIY